jgi:hypothetical protein
MPATPPVDDSEFPLPQGEPETMLKEYGCPYGMGDPRTLIWLDGCRRGYSTAIADARRINAEVFGKL